MPEISSYKTGLLKRRQFCANESGQAGSAFVEITTQTRSDGDNGKK
jgi:hypothetical protein